MTIFCFFFFNDTATTEIYTLSLHDALPISMPYSRVWDASAAVKNPVPDAHIYFRKAMMYPNGDLLVVYEDRKSTRLNSSHANISYAVFCLKKKKNLQKTLLSIHQQQVSLCQ